MKTFQRPEPRPLPNEENYVEGELSKEASEWDSQICELCTKFKEVGNVVFSNSNHIMNEHKKAVIACTFPQLVFTPPGAYTDDFYATVGDRVRFKKGSKGKTGNITAMIDDLCQDLTVGWDDGTEEKGIWCGKKETFQLVYAAEK